MVAFGTQRLSVQDIRRSAMLVRDDMISLEIRSKLYLAQDADAISSQEYRLTLDRVKYSVVCHPVCAQLGFRPSPAQRTDENAVVKRAPIGGYEA